MNFPEIPKNKFLKLNSMHIKLTILFLTIFNFLYCQDKFISKRDSSKLIQLSGVVLSETSLDQLPYSTIIDLTIKKGTLTDSYGFFTLVTYPGDTLAFSSFGYKSGTYVVPDSLIDNRYSIIHVLKEDTNFLPQVTIYPWPSKENFAKAFVEMEPYSDAFQKAKQQLSGESLAFAAAKLQSDASLSYGTTQSQMYTQLYAHGQQPVNNLFNPYAWSKFITEWKNGNLKIK
jgi:hypothetical protein